LSRVYHVWTFRDTKWWEISFAYGRPKQVLCNCPAPKHPVSGAPLKKGTLVYLEPDPKIFECIGARGLSKVFSLKSPTTTMLLEWCRIASYFTPGLTLRVGHNTGIVKEFVSQDGPKDFIARKLDQLNRERSAEDGEKAEPIGLIEEGAEFVSQDALYDCVVAFTNSENANLDAFTNGLRNAEGGLHLTAFLNALQGAITPFAAKGSNFTQRELREGLVALVNVKLSAPQFDSQTKEKLVDQRAGKPVFESLFAAFQAFFAERPLLAKRICERATSLHSLRTKFLASKKVVSKLRDVAKKGLPVKGQVSPDCTAEQRELYIVEGDSAAGSVRNARDPFYQEALPIRGKVTNAAKDPKNKAIESDEIINILAQMGFDPKAENPLEKLRVSKIICLADPDPDGPLTGDSTVPVRFQGTWTVETMEDLASDRWAGVEYDVLAWNGKSFCITEAEDCRVTEIVNKLVVITLANGEKIRCAEGHELAIITNRPVLRDVLPSNVGLYMVPASKLKAGDVLASVEDGVVKHQWHNLSGRQYLGGIRVEKVKTQAAEGTPVYCLTVPGYHNFVLSSGVLSKNCHINSLLLTLLYKFLPGLFAKGMVYVAEVPEFYAIPKKHSPLFDTKPAALQAQLDKAGLKAEICHIKGYGEIDSDILKTLAFDPATRNVIKIVPTESMNGEVEFMKLMGGGSESRKLLLGI
jgi:DNA gyrase/topoisomerase IV subunit B